MNKAIKSSLRSLHKKKIRKNRLMNLSKKLKSNITKRKESALKYKNG